MNSPIGIFDSGLGGLSVARELLKALPNERIIYFADNEHVPYGERPFEQVREFACGITDFLVKQGAKAVVMACNMSSAVALDAARELHPEIPVLGVIGPGTRAAHRISDGLPIGVLATTGTVKSRAYVDAITKISPDCCVVQQACPDFVPLIESGRADSEEAQIAAVKYTEEILEKGCKTVVLGCTHYPFVKDAISRAVGSDVAIVDPAFETVKELSELLTARGLSAKGNTGHNVYYASGETHMFAELGSIFMGVGDLKAERALWRDSSLMVELSAASR